MAKKGLPTVVIVGRTNVGKSTLFNRLSTDVKTLTLDYEGVTRDFIRDQVSWQGHNFDLIDTGGISLRKTTDHILEESRKKALHLIEHADIVIFVCDAKVGLLPEDREIARLLHKLGVKTIVVANKVDTHVGQEQEHEFTRLGFENFISISAQHGFGIADLLQAIVDALPDQSSEHIEEAAPKCKVTILGKPNVGKSSLLNLLLKEERAIVADIPGTTREPISERVIFNKESIMLTDTPGIRRKRGVTETIEQMMVKTSLRAIDQADVVLLMIDAHEAGIVDQELKLAFYVFEERSKGLIILYNKSDLVDEVIKADLAFSLEPYDYFLKKVAQLTISCKSGKNVGKLLQLVDDVCKRYHHRFSDDELTVLFKETLFKKPFYKQEQLMRLFGVRQISTAPITIELTVDNPLFWGETHFNYLDTVLRKHIDLRGVPVKFVVTRKK
jgi:GTP-binding protein